MTQPEWKFVANLGDVNPIDHGGFFVYEDTTGMYAPEAECLDVLDDDDSGRRRKLIVYRFSLEKLEDGQTEWFSDDLESVAPYCGLNVDELRAAFSSDDILTRAHAYRSVAEYLGYKNFDEYALRLSRAEARERYADCVKS